MMELIDTHSHIFVEEFASDLSEVIDRAKKTGVSRIYMPNIDLESLPSLLNVSERYADYCYPLLGLHPTSVDGDFAVALTRLKSFLTTGSPFVGIGEVGLDYYWGTAYKREQQQAFEMQLQWSLEYNLPLVIHCREALPDLMRIMRSYRADSRLRGVFHSFTGTYDEALCLLEFPNFYIGINGVVTFKNSSLSSVLPSIPIERLVLETDSPYLTPAPHRGRRNESSYVKFVLEKIAEIFLVPSEEVARITSHNAKMLFNTSEMHL